MCTQEKSEGISSVVDLIWYYKGISELSEAPWVCSAGWWLMLIYMFWDKNSITWWLIINTLLFRFIMWLFSIWSNPVSTLHQHVLSYQPRHIAIKCQQVNDACRQEQRFWAKNDRHVNGWTNDDQTTTALSLKNNSNAVFLIGYSYVLV
jgi:hypothetical protein